MEVMKKTIIISFLLLVGGYGFGQNTLKDKAFESLKGYWFNPNNKSYLEIKKDSCLLNVKAYYGNDTIGHYETKGYRLNLKHNRLKLISKYYLTTGIRFWRLKNRCTYHVEIAKNDSSPILSLFKKNHKKRNTIAIFIGGDNINYKRVSLEEYLSINAIRYEFE
jgi:hypothetical protein